MGVGERRQGPRQLQLRRLHEQHLDVVHQQRDGERPGAMVQRGLLIHPGHHLQLRLHGREASGHYRSASTLHQQSHGDVRVGTVGRRYLRPRPRGQQGAHLEGHAAHRRQDGEASELEVPGLGDQRGW